ncbi:hypothetical protein BDV23DRAFT_164918 [Aspergillus alliaceus]|uniref:Uncharacterized protein n=1 Tax=Petromyces alliaceus TaxID=209559 RepID=A0A5N7BUE7_PETAA|nr:hypothetical protein BDV23DRAFT_164918 [Aspergillus alliaceus]
MQSALGVYSGTHSATLVFNDPPSNDISSLSTTINETLARESNNKTVIFLFSLAAFTSGLFLMVW